MVKINDEGKDSEAQPLTRGEQNFNDAIQKSKENPDDITGAVPDLALCDDGFKPRFFLNVDYAQMKIIKDSDCGRFGVFL